MSIHRVTDLDFAEVAATNYDVAVFSSGYEERCTHVPSSLCRSRSANAIVLGFKDLSESPQRKLHDEFFRQEWGVNAITTSAGNDYKIQNLLNRLISDRVKISRLVVDCSSMSRLWYAGILNWARYGNGGAETIVDFVYACGKYEEKNPPMIIEDMVTIPGCEGGAFRSQPSVAIFGLGFNGWASLSVLERLEADEVYAFIASPGGSADYPERVRTVNRDFLEEPRVNDQLLELPLKSVEAAYRLLSEVVTPHRRKASVTLVPMGPKPHILASILVSLKFPEVSCMRVNMSRERPERVKPTGDVIAVRIVVRKQVQQ